LNYRLPVNDLCREGSTEGLLVGGNLSILYSLAGTASDIDTEGKILFLEDLDEYLYHVDRMMINMKRSGKLANLAGLIIGGMTDMRDNEVPFGKSAWQIIAEAVEEYSYPVYFDFPAGHQKDNRALILGRRVKFEVGKEMTLSF
jgi:muramoyltetrapeptide carboxypeptidase